MALSLNTMMVLLFVLLLAFAVYISKREKFQRFGALADYSDVYMDCLNKCDSEPGWRSLNPGDRGALQCANRCDDVLSHMAKGECPVPRVETSHDRAFKVCGKYEDDPECHRRSVCKENVEKWCAEECDFGTLDKEKCEKMCIASHSNNCSFGAWTFH